MASPAQGEFRHAPPEGEETVMPGMPPNGAAEGGQIDSLMVLVHLLMVVVFAGWGIYFVAVLLRGRRSGSPAGGKLRRVGIGSEVAIVCAEVGLLAGIALPFWNQRVSASPDERGATVVRVVAEQFAWNIHYPGPDGRFGRTDLSLVGPDNPVGLDRTDPAAKDDIVLLNQMHLPVGRPVVVYLTSKDVIHSFALPLYRIKQDAIPGQRVAVSFTPERTTEQLRPGLTSSYAIDPSDSTHDLSLLSPVSDVPGADGRVLVTAGTPLTPDVVSQLAGAGVKHVRAAPDTPTEIACAQLCGLGHYRMKGIVVVETDSAFSAWMADQEASLTQ